MKKALKHLTYIVLLVSLYYLIITQKLNAIIMREAAKLEDAISSINVSYYAVLIIISIILMVFWLHERRKFQKEFEDMINSCKEEEDAWKREIEESKR